MNGSITYNSQSLQTFDRAAKVGINTNVIKHTDQPEAVGDLVALANASDSTVPTNEYISKVIVISGSISGSTQADLDSRIDSFKAIFNKRNKPLDIQFGESIRRYTVMKINTVAVERQNVVLWASFTVELLCKPFGIETQATVIADLPGETTASHTISPTIGGSAPYQLPIFTFTINSLTGAGDYIQVSNDNNGQQLLITGAALSDGDVVIIDTPARKVTVNGSEVNYSGTFIELEPGEQSFTITDGFDTRSMDILIEYFKRFF